MTGYILWNRRTRRYYRMKTDRRRKAGNKRFLVECDKGDATVFKTLYQAGYAATYKAPDYGWYIDRIEVTEGR